MSNPKYIPSYPSLVPLTGMRVDEVEYSRTNLSVLFLHSFQSSANVSCNCAEINNNNSIVILSSNIYVVKKIVININLETTIVFSITVVDIINHTLKVTVRQLFC